MYHCNETHTLQYIHMRYMLKRDSAQTEQPPLGCHSELDSNGNASTALT